MPIIVTPTPPPTFPVVSTDLALTATVRADLGGVLLKVTPQAGQAPAAFCRVTVRRVAAGVSTLVRGMDAVLSPGGSLLGLDAECPLGVPCTYRVTLAATAGTFTSTAVAVTVPAPRGRQWLKHPTVPGLSMQVQIDQQPEWKSTRPTTVLRVVDRRNPVTTAGVRGAAVAGVSVYLTDTDMQDRFDALLDEGGPYLLQADASQPNRRDRWVVITEDTFSQPGIGAGFRSVPVDLTEVDRPGTAGSSVSIPGHRYADLAGAWSGLPGAYLDL